MNPTLQAHQQWHFICCRRADLKLKMGKMTKGVMFEENLPAKCRLVQWKPVLSWNPVSSHFHYVCLLSLWPVYWSVNARKISSIKKKKGTFSEMLDNSRGIVLWNLSHTLLKRKWKIQWLNLRLLVNFIIQSTVGQIVFTSCELFISLFSPTCIIQLNQSTSLHCHSTNWAPRKKTGRCSGTVRK